MIHVFDMENLDEVATIDHREVLDGSRVFAMEWITDHRNGQLWLHDENARLHQCFVDEDWNLEEVQAFDTNGGAHAGLAHDGENLWRGRYDNHRTWYVIDDGVREFYMLTVDPEEGVVPGDDSETVNISINPEGYEAGVYNVLLAIELSEPEENRDDLEQTLIEI